MTSPALLVLSLALVCSIIGIASEHTADHDEMIVDINTAIDSEFKHKTWTNLIYHNENINEVITSNAVIKIPDNKMILKRNDVKIREFRVNDRTFSRIDKPFYRGNDKAIYVEDKNIIGPKYDEIYSKDSIVRTNLRLHKINIENKSKRSIIDSDNVNKSLEIRKRFKRDDSELKSRVKRDDDELCEFFKFTGREPYVIMHPHAKNRSTYYNNSNCVTIINATDGKVIELTFVDIFRIENHPQCSYDYLEIRDGQHGYAKLLDKVCGQAFPRQIITTGPYAWLKFRSDDTIEYEGFKINIAFLDRMGTRIPPECTIQLEKEYGTIDSSKINTECTTGSANQALDVLWRIDVAAGSKIYLNFTEYHLAQPNECEHNVIQVFGSLLELEYMLAHYCGSVANSVTTKEEVRKDGSEEKGNVMYVRLYASKAAKGSTYFKATYNAYRTLDTNNDPTAECIKDVEFSCEDNTCIDYNLRCDGTAHCRLKADEEKTECNNKAEETLKGVHIKIILVIFSLILSGMCFVFLFKCIRKLYQDHKLIAEHLKQSCEDRLDSLDSSQLTLDPKKLTESEPRASLERENQTNEMYKKQRSFSKHEPSIRDSDFQEETRVDLELDLDDDPWRRDVDSVPHENHDIRERNGRNRRSDLSRKEESMRSRTHETGDSRKKKEIRDVSVGAPDTKESGCQTRESLFQTDPPPSSDGSGSHSRGFSTFGYSGATIVRPSPPNQTKTSEITIELLKQVPPQESKPQKKIDRRPISTETTRSAPDVIIVSKPIR